MTQDSDFDVIIIGGGHAGCEAAHASARLGCRTALISLDPTKIGVLSCNPAMGGLAKGQLVKEIDALGGIMGRVTDQSAIQYRRLNAKKGPAVRSSRAQCDKALYAKNMQSLLAGLNQELKSEGGGGSLEIISAEVSDLFFESSDSGESKNLRGVEVTRLGSTGVETIGAKAVVITSGTFLSAIMHTGEKQEVGGRVGERASFGLSESMKRLGFKLRRLKTGTPPRLDGRTIDFSKTIEQKGDEKPLPFSFFQKLSPFPILPQISCFITHTNEKTHSIIEENFHRSPMFQGVIKGVGPRYCPSIEDKVKRFRDKDRHQIFLEPEGLTTDSVYVNGVSTSLPKDVQDGFIRSIEGLEKAEFFKYGYAVEYDAVDARQLKATLESKDVAGLFMAGQVNGTSGYEEAGAQGLIAGINAAQQIKGCESFTLGRDEGYIGVLIDDLVLKGSDEPYRMFTSRAEYRLLLREDNADFRLSERAYGIGLLSEADHELFLAKRSRFDGAMKALQSFYAYPDKETKLWFEKRGLRELKDRASGDSLLKRPDFGWNELKELGFRDKELSEDLRERVEIQIKYEGYIKRDLELLASVKKNEGVRLPLALPYGEISGLSNEIRSRLGEVRPETLGQMGRIQGVTPAAVANVMIYLKMQKKSGKTLSKRGRREEFLS